MKKISFAIIAATLLVSCVFAACKGADSGKITDPAHTDPILTTLEDMLTEAATDFSEMFTGDMTNNLTDNVSDTAPTTIA